MTADPHTRDHRLSAIGDALEQAVAADLRRASSRPAVPARRRWRPRRRLALLSVAALIVIPGAALAATDLFWSDSQVAASLPQGTLALGGTDPSCTTVIANVEYHCALAKPPSTSGAPSSADASAPPTAGSINWKGTVEPTVDSTKHVNGGCRARNSAGTEWECYIGQAAVSQRIISRGFLGQYAPGPGVG